MIELEHVTKKYGSITALSDVSFRAENRRTVGLLGRNGAGKTTALNLMTGYMPPDSGRVLVDGMDMMTHARECKRRIGYLPERPPLYDEMTVREYLNFVCDLKEVMRKDRKAHTDEITEMCALTDVRDRLIGHLSKGYRQRVGIAQALCGNPELIILDEPTVGLDPMQVVEIREMIRELGKDHTVLFSSHILTEVQQLCSTAVILNVGRMIRTVDLTGEGSDTVTLRVSVAGKPKDILPGVRSIEGIRKTETLSSGDPGVTELRLTCAKKTARGRVTDQLFHLFAAMDTPIRMLAPEADSLEDVFLHATEREDDVP